MVKYYISLSYNFWSIGDFEFVQGRDKEFMYARRLNSESKSWWERLRSTGWKTASNTETRTYPCNFRN